MSRILGTQSYLHLLFRRSPFEWDQLTRTKSEPISTGPFPTWDDCQQLLQVLFTTEERERILAEARKRVPGPTGGQPPSLISRTRAA